LCAIRTPAEYVDSLKEYREGLTQIRNQVASVMTAPATTAGPGTTGSSPEEKKRKQAQASTAVSKKFMVSCTYCALHPVLNG
jgi:hypothetical protein